MIRMIRYWHAVECAFWLGALIGLEAVALQGWWIA